MNAPNPIEPQVASSDDKRPQEPSMEDILASIRRIIADDQSMPAHSTAPDEAAAPIEFVPSDPQPLRGTIPSAERATVGEQSPAEPAPAPLRAHLMRGDTVELDFRTMRHAASVRTVHAPDPQSSAPDRGASRAEAFERPASPAIDVIATPPFAGRRQSDHSDETATMREQPQEAEPGREAETAKPDDMWRPPVSRSGYVEPPQAPVSTDHARAPENPREEPDLAVEHDYDEPIGETAEPERGLVLPTEALFSAATDASVTAAFKTLAASRLADNADELLDIAREMIRPLLKTWIDDNVPSMVERMIRAEIERVARGR